MRQSVDSPFMSKCNRRRIVSGSLIYGVSTCVAVFLAAATATLNRNRNDSVRTLLLCLLLYGVTACSGNEPQPVKVNLKPETGAGHTVRNAGEKPLRFGMGAMITPKEGAVYYQQLQEYLAKKIGRPVQLVDRGNYDEINGLMETGGLDAAFVCAGPYVEGRQKFGMELLAMPVVNGQPVYYAYIIVHRDSPIKTFSDLRGKSFAFTDPKSNTGKLVPTYMLARMQQTPESFFSRSIFTYGHDNSIKAVAQKHVDGASVDSLIWDYAARKTPQTTALTRIILKSDPYGIPPVVAHPSMDPALKKLLRDTLLTIHQDPDGKPILAGMMIDRFVPGDDANYNTIRTMNTWVAGRQKRTK